MLSETTPSVAVTKSQSLELPRLPALGWATFAGRKRSPLPSVLDNRDIRFTTSGRAAIALALRALNVRTGDRVLVPTYHCPTMIAPVVAIGAEPVFFAIDATGAPRIDNLGSSDLRGVRAMIAAHYFGLPQPMARLRSFCDDHGIALIEDCAHALFGMSDGRAVGQWGDYAIASLTKFLPVMDGGCLVAAQGFAGAQDLMPLSTGAELKSFANAVEIGARYGRTVGLSRVLSQLFALASRLRGRPSDPLPEIYPFPAPNGIDKWLADFESPSRELRSASWWTRWTVRHAHRGRIVVLRRRNYAILADLFKDVPGVRALQPVLSESAAPYVFPLEVDRPDAIYMQVRAAGIPVFRWDEVWPSCPTIAGDLGRRWATHVFQIGCHQDLRPADLADMARVLSALVTSGTGRTPDRVPSGAAFDKLPSRLSNSCAFRTHPAR
jgi:dTDP-4-amino-4,6-dideoxygalactose transaminase